MIRWMAEHKVAANLLMLILLVWGGMSTCLLYTSPSPRDRQKSIESPYFLM